jgi:hypothetical protein
MKRYSVCFLNIENKFEKGENSGKSLLKKQLDFSLNLFKIKD